MASRSRRTHLLAAIAASASRSTSAVEHALPSCTSVSAARTLPASAVSASWSSMARRVAVRACRLCRATASRIARLLRSIEVGAPAAMRLELLAQAFRLRFVFAEQRVGVLPAHRGLVARLRQPPHAGLFAAHDGAFPRSSPPALAHTVPFGPQSTTMTEMLSSPPFAIAASNSRAAVARGEDASRQSSISD
jgi:hypothetical protein